jgi:hypothetical protein
MHQIIFGQKDRNAIRSKRKDKNAKRKKKIILKTDLI